MFTLSALRAAMALPWRAHVWHALLVAGAVAIFAWASAVLQYTPAAGRTIKDPAAMAKAQVVLMGNSQMDMIAGRPLTFPSDFLTLGGSGYRIQNALLRTWAPKLPELRMIVLGFDNIPLRVPDIEERMGDYSDLDAIGLPWYRVPTRWRDRFRFFVRYSPMFRDVFLGERVGIAQLGHWPIGTAEAAESPRTARSVYALAPGYDTLPVGGYGKIGSYQHRYNDERIRALGETAFFDLLSHCEAQGIHVVLFRAPTTRAFHGGRTPAWDAELVALLNEARRRFPKLALPVWDAETQLHLPVEFFFDPNHLASEGAAATVNFLNLRLLQSPSPDDAGRLFAFKRENLLVTPDPREDAWIGIEKSDATVTRLEAPVQSQGVNTSAYRITLLPGQSLACPTHSPLAMGQRLETSLWIWSDVDSTATDLLVMLGPEASSGGAVSAARIMGLGAVPQRLDLAHQVVADARAGRMQFTNNAAAALTFTITGPVVQSRN